MEYSRTVTVHLVEADEAQDAALEAALSLLLSEYERQQPQAVSQLFGATISLQQPVQAG